MTALLYAVSIAVGILCSEVLIRSLAARAWLRVRLREARALLASFHAAVGDDERQPALIRAGKATLAVSLAALAGIAFIGALFFLPAVAFGWEGASTTTYYVIATVAAIAWWLGRARVLR
jgi:hypothetical protein